jgi:rhodanese-related sulfurtransferase
LSTSPTLVDPGELEAWIRGETEIQILDVRTPAEFENAHIPGAYNVPLDLLGEHTAEIHRHLDRPVVIVCRAGTRAAQAEQKLAAHGMENIRVLEGGMAAWERSFTEPTQLRRGRQRWDLERQVRLVAGSAVLAGIVASIWIPKARFAAGAIGLGLTAAALTNTCAMGTALSKLPYNRGSSCDIDSILERLADPSPA